jgi:dihydrofolate reductase
VVVASAERHMNAAVSSDLIAGGPNLAAQAFKAGPVCGWHLFIWPVILGEGKPALPTDTRLSSPSSTCATFSYGVAHLRYRLLWEARSASTGTKIHRAERLEPPAQS